MSHPFQQVDVFGATPLYGNPVAVVFDAQRLSDARMQAIARWTNLSETTFVLPPTRDGADYRVRIFTPGGELPFAGHPTLGTCHAWLHDGGQPEREGEVVQECTVGLVRIRRAGGARLAFAAPPLVRREPEPEVLAAVCHALGVPPARVRAAQLLDNGPTWLGLLLDSAETVLRLAPDHAALQALPKVGVIGAYPDGSELAFEVRGFAASAGIAEDPVTGSLNASLAQWLIAAGLAPAHYVAAQGTRLGRAGRVYIEQHDEAVWVGGDCTTVVQGMLFGTAA